MVDVDSALRASAYSGKKRKGGPGTTEKASTELEPFDPSHHAQKEKADAVSMWLVIFFGALVATSMRYLLMPTMDNSEQVLWLLPVLLIGLVRPLHRVLIPSGIFEIYTGGNWFRASFLYLFTWLALSFALVNPPLADIAAPHLAGDIDIKAESEMMDETSYSRGEFEILIDEDTVNITLGLAVRDNVDAGNSTISLIIYEKGNRDQPLVHIINGTTSQIAESGPSNTFSSVADEEWLRGLKKNTLTNKYGEPKVSPSTEDIRMAWDICSGGCEVGTYYIEIELFEEDPRVPWSTGKNVWEEDYTLRILKAST